MFLGPIFHRYPEGYRFAKLAGAVVEKHDFSTYRAKVQVGDIQVESRVGQGSTFWFELKAPVVDAALSTTPDRIVTGYAGPRKLVLVVDDVAENRTVAAHMLRPLGFEVVEAANGREGLEIAQSLRPHLILMDIAMPEMDGLEAVRRLRQLATFKDVPVMATSASVSAADSKKSLEAGMNAFLPKERARNNFPIWTGPTECNARREKES